MISVQWHNDGTCENCGENKPHCAEIAVEKFNDNEYVNPPKPSVLLCSDCIHELKTKLS